jgi:hypothetical protein
MVCDVVQNKFPASIQSAVFIQSRDRRDDG